MTDSFDIKKSHYPALHDLEMTTRFLRVLTGNSDEAVTYQMFDDKKVDNSLARWFHRKSSPRLTKDFITFQSNGAGIFIMVNRGNCNGRKAENVIEVRALFIDLDGSPWEPAADMLKPHIRVESSPGRYHLYWLVSDCPLDQFKPIQQAIAKQFDGDKSCVDLCRVLRLPGFLHQKKEPVLTKLIEANDFPKYTTQQVIEGLQLDMSEVTANTATKQPKTSTAASIPQAVSSLVYEFTDKATGEVLNLTTWAAQNPAFDIIAAVDNQYHRDIQNDGRQHIQCPFEYQHTDAGKDLATFIANASPPQYNAWDVHCCHSHCVDRGRLDFILAMLEKGWITVDQLQPTAPTALELKRPPYFNYRAQEIAAGLVKQPLQPQEFQYNLHLMHVAGTAYDGTLPDDSWTISRILGITENRWIEEVKPTLIRSGWQVVENGRIFNQITLREYQVSQFELARKISGGKIGGLKTQQIKREREAHKQSISSIT